MLVASVATHSHSASEPATAASLVAVATQFNEDYHLNHDAAVWDRFDPASQAVIARATYVRWHAQCPQAAPGPSTVLSAVAQSQGWWVVTYQMSGVSLHDYWHRVGGRWRFSLLRSNPASAQRYAGSFAAWSRAVGCVTS